MKKARFARISDFCQTGSGTTPSRQNLERYYGGNIPWVKSGELRETEIMQTEECVTEAAIQETSLKVVSSGALLVAMYGATVGRVGRLGIDAATNQAVCHIIPDESLAHAQYMFHALCAKASELVAKGVGGAQPNISQGTIKDTEIYLPPLEEQRRIAAILDKADAIRRKRLQALAETDTLLRSVFLDMFGDPVTNPKKLPREPLGKLMQVKSGEFLPAREMVQSGPHAVYGGNGINGRHSDYMFKEQKIVIGRVGAYCGVVHVSEPFSWVTDNALYVSKTRQDIEFDYLTWALRFANLNQYAGQAAQPLISGSRIYPVEVLVPKLETQSDFARALCRMDTLRGGLGRQADTSEGLFQALSQRAFRGEL